VFIIFIIFDTTVILEYFSKFKNILCLASLADLGFEQKSLNLIYKSSRSENKHSAGYSSGYTKEFGRSG
jgi:hypothetical protein